MIIDCGSCGTTYNISDEKVRGRRVRVRCKTCGEAIVVDGQQLPAEDQTRPLRLEDTTRRLASNFEEEEEESTRVMSAPPAFGRLVSGPRSAPPPPPPADEEWTVNFSDTDSRTLSLSAIVDAYTSGLLPDDAFAWKPGMNDWLPYMEVPEIRTAIASAAPTRVASVASLGSHSAPIAHAPPVVHAPPVQQAAVYEQPTAPRSQAKAASRAQTTAPRVAARAATAREQKPDLFSRARSAGSEEELLANSTEPAVERYDHKPTGVRNESSVLFSLDKLTASRAPAVGPPTAAAGTPKTAADILGLGSASAPSFNMSTNAALLTAPAAEPEPPPASVRRARMDTTPPIARRSRSGVVWMLVGVIGTIVVLGGAGLAFMVARGMPVPFPVPSSIAQQLQQEPAALPTPAVPTVTAPSATIAVAASASPATPVVATAPAAPVATGAPAANQPAAPTPAAPGKASAARPPSAKSTGATAPTAGTESAGGIPKVVLEEEQAPKAGGETATPAPSGPAFDTAAAKAALSSAAAAASGCQQPDGPTGKGKVQVTFAPSGRAMSANVGGDFAGTAVGSCVARAFKNATVPAFSGDPVTVSKSFTVGP